MLMYITLAILGGYCMESGSSEGTLDIIATFILPSTVISHWATTECPFLSLSKACQG